MIYNENTIAPQITEYLETGKGIDKIIRAFYRLARHIAYTKKFSFNKDKEDLVQNAVIRVVNNLYMWDKDLGRSYSYFYVAIYRSFIYDIRIRNRKKSREGEYKENIKYNYEEDLKEHQIKFDTNSMWERARDVIREVRAPYSQEKYMLALDIIIDEYNKGKRTRNVAGFTQIQSVKKLLRDHKNYIRYNKGGCISFDRFVKETD